MKKIIFGLSVLFLLNNCTRQSEYTVKVMTYNVRHGVSMNWKPSLKQQAEIINIHRPNWIGLQEIDKNCKRSGSVDQATRFAELTGTNGIFGKFMDFDSGEYGMASLSRLKIVDSEILKLPTGAEPRVAIIQIAEITKHINLALVNVHFDWTSSELRIPQAMKLLDRLNQIELPTIIIGDYNAEPGSKTLNLFEKHGYTAVKKGVNHLTWNAENPTRELDHVFFRGDKNITITPNYILVLDEPEASDHRPVIAEVVIKKL